MTSELSINPGVELRNAALELHHFQVRLAVAAGLVLHRRVRMFSGTPQVLHVVLLLLMNDLI
ncbi:MAG: hypothetical protein ACREVR_10425, partial [Burkholderiales bacterium]